MVARAVSIHEERKNGAKPIYQAKPNRQAMPNRQAKPSHQAKQNYESTPGKIKSKLDYLNIISSAGK